jgi:hypothetical protein
MSTSVSIDTSIQEWMEERELEIFSHLSWHGDISGIECEDFLRGLPPGSYLLREGERRFQYYLSFVIGNSFTFKHQPFLITLDHSQIVWGYRNGIYNWASTLEELLPLAMHCHIRDCHPVVKKIDG